MFTNSVFSENFTAYSKVSFSVGLIFKSHVIKNLTIKFSHVLSTVYINLTVWYLALFVLILCLFVGRVYDVKDGFFHSYFLKRH